MQIEDIKNKKFNQLTVLSFVEVRGKSGHAYWKVKCDCGAIKIMRASHLKSMKMISCGCYNKKRSSIMLKKYANSDAHKGEGNPSWKGKNAKVSSKHTWLTKYYKKGPCEHCGENKKLRDWALIKGKEYEHNRDNYMPLCRSCHLKYDYTEERKAKLRKSI